MNVENLRKASALKAKKCHDRVAAAIAKIVSSGQRLTFSSVSQEAGVSRTYLYRNEKFRQAISGAEYRSSDKSKSLESLVQIQKVEISRLSKELSSAQKQLEKLNALKAENEALKKQLRVAYSYD